MIASLSCLSAGWTTYPDLTYCAALAAATSRRVSDDIIYSIYVVTHYSRLGSDREKSRISTSEVSAQQGMAAYF